MIKWLILALWLLPAAYTHWRGRVRHGWLKQLVNHSTLLAPVNGFMYAFSRVPNTPYLPVERFPELARITSHWQEIRQEALRLREAQAIRAANAHNDAGFNSFFKEGWKRFYVKWYDEAHPSARELCPRTVELLAAVPSVKAAMFTELPPGSHLNPHRDPYAGSLRYHLGLATPNQDGCYIEVDGERYSWRDGQAVIFDETYVHSAANGTNEDRIVLFCDVERPMRWRWAQAFNGWFGRHVIAAASSPNQAGDRTGWVNQAFAAWWRFTRLRGRIKDWNRNAYTALKWLLILGVVALIVWL